MSINPTSLPNQPAREGGRNLWQRDKKVVVAHAMEMKRLQVQDELFAKLANQHQQLRVVANPTKSPKAWEEVDEMEVENSRQGRSGVTVHPKDFLSRDFSTTLGLSSTTRYQPLQN
jgi:hypothetical protein